MVVVFGRMIADVKVIGPGSRIVVFIGAKGDIAGLQMKWRMLADEPAKMVRPLPISDIANQFIEDIRKSYGDVRIDSSNVQIKQCEHGLFAQNRRNLQNYMQPAYAIGYEIIDESITSSQMMIYPAYADPVEPLTQPPKEAAAPKEGRQQ
jgi:hypothetical protein